MIVALAGDHAGLPIRDRLAEVVAGAGHVPLLVGPDDSDGKIDYPIAAEAVGRAIGSALAHRGILICGSGAGMCVAANRMPGVRAATAPDVYTAAQMVEHDAVNVLTLGARILDPDTCDEIVRAFIGATFDGADRYSRRLQQVHDLERKRNMNPLFHLHAAGQSPWLDNIRRDILDDGTIARYISDYSVTGLTSNPTIFCKAIADTDLYDEAIGDCPDDADPQEIFFSLALDDLTRAASLFEATWQATCGNDGCVSLEVSPVLANDAAATIQQAAMLWDRVECPNLLIKIPGTHEGAEAIEATIAAGINVNVTLLFSPDQYEAAAEAYIAGIEQRHAKGLDLGVTSVASIFVSRWDGPTREHLADDLCNRVGIAMTTQCYRSYRRLFSSDRWKTLEAAGARPQRLLVASTSVKDPSLKPTFYCEALIAPGTINTMPEATLHAFAKEGVVGDPIPEDGGDADAILARVEESGIDLGSLATQLQEQGRDAFIASWHELIDAIAAKRSALQQA